MGCFDFDEICLPEFQTFAQPLYLLAKSTIGLTFKTIFMNKIYAALMLFQKLIVNVRA